MNQIKKKYLTISKGQISEKLIERSDIDLLDKSGQEITNFRNSNFGSLKTFENISLLSSNLKWGNKIFPVIDSSGLQCWLMFDYEHIYLIGPDGSESASLNITDFDPSNINITVAQYNELILVSTGGRYPIWKLTIDSFNGILTKETYIIDERYLPKQSPVQDSIIQSPTSNFIQIELNEIRKQTFNIENLRLEQTEGLGNTGSKGKFNIYFVNNGNQSDNFLKCRLYRPSAPSIHLNTQVQKIFAGQIIKANNNTQIIRIEGVNYSVDNNDIKISSIQGVFLVGADNIDSATGKMSVTDKWTLEVCPPIFSGSNINTSDSPWLIENYPLTISFYQNRLVIGGSTLNTAQIVFSKTGDFNDFSSVDGLATDGFQLIIGSDKTEVIQHLIVRQGLQIFCEKSEWQLEGGTVSKTNGFIKNSEIGSSLTKPIISPNGSTLFVNKEGNNLVEYQYNYTTNSYDIPYLNILSDIIGDSEIKHLYIDKTNEGSYIYACLSNGDLIIMNYMQSHKIESFTRYHFDGIYFISTSKANINGNDNIIFFVVNAKIGKTSVLCANYNYTVRINALGITTNFRKTGNTISFDLYSILNGQKEINLYDSNGKYINTYATNDNESNTITLSDEDAQKNITYIGINIHSKFVSNPLNYGLTTFDKYKSIAQLKIVLSKESNGEFLKVNGKKGRIKDNYITFYRVARPQRKCQFIIENDIYPCEILSMEVDLEI